MVKEENLHDYGGTICVFCPSFSRLGRRDNRIDGVGTERYVFAYQSMLKGFITSEASFEDLKGSGYKSLKKSLMAQG